MLTTRLFRAVALGALALLIGPAALAETVTVRNPIAGFQIDIPDDWEMAAGTALNTVIAIDAASGPAYATKPVLWFFHAPLEPAEEAAGIATSLTAMAGGATPQVSQGPGAGEFVIRMTSNGARGPLTECWVCRSQDGVSYVIGAMARPEAWGPSAADIDRALASCRLIDRPQLEAFREPTETAYRILLPVGWKWSGEILRAEAVPGYFVWKAASPDGATGCFSSPPGVFNIATEYMPAGAAIDQIVLPYLRQQIPDARLIAVQELPGAGAYYRELIQKAGIGQNPRVDKVRADFSAAGGAVRIRIDVLTLQFDTSQILGGRGDWFLYTSGYWAPEAQFDELGPLGRGVLASLRTDRQWKKNQRDAVAGVLGPRQDAMDAFADAWDNYIRE
jgi:hypothetical protein